MACRSPALFCAEIDAYPDNQDLMPDLLPISDADNDGSPAAAAHARSYPKLLAKNNKNDGAAAGAHEVRIGCRPFECVICHRPANCCHYDVPSCPGCRSFFRRSVLQRRQYTCPRAGNCPIGEGQLCRSCRYDRCLLGGMRIWAIKSYDQREDLQKLAVELERRRHHLLDKQQQEEEEDGVQQSISPPAAVVVAAGVVDSTLLLETTRTLHRLMLADDQLLRIRYSEQRLLADVFGKYSLMGLLESSGNFLANAELFSKRRLPQLSLQFHRELIENPPPGDGHPSPKRPSWLFVDAFLCLHLAKTLSTFQELSPAGRLCLLSHNGLVATVFSQSFYSFSWNSQEIFVFPDGMSPICYPPCSFLEEKRREKIFCGNMAAFKRIGLTREEFLLLRSILLLHSAAIDELSQSDRRILQAGQESYSRALMQYEQHRLGKRAGVQRFAELMFFTQFMHKVGNEHRSFLLLLVVVLQVPRMSSNIHPRFIDNLILGVGTQTD